LGNQTWWVQSSLIAINIRRTEGDDYGRSVELFTSPIDKFGHGPYIRHDFKDRIGVAPVQPDGLDQLRPMGNPALSDCMQFMPRRSPGRRSITDGDPSTADVLNNSVP
jgi:hypothetical protein